MSNGSSEPRKATDPFGNQSLNRAEDPGTVKSPEQLENRLTSHDFMKMQALFKCPESNENMRMLTREEFIDKMCTAVRQGSKEEYGKLFDKIDLIRDGVIDWDKLTSFMLLELCERDERTKQSIIPQWKDLRLLPSIHKDAVQKITCLKSPSSYLTVSRRGLLSLWGESLKLQRTLQITMETVKPKDLWVTSLVTLPNVNKVAVAFTSKEIHFAELNSKQGFSCQYRLQGLEGTVICMDYWYNPHDGNDAILTMGDVCGQASIAQNPALLCQFLAGLGTCTDWMQSSLASRWLGEVHQHSSGIWQSGVVVLERNFNVFKPALEGHIFLFSVGMCPVVPELSGKLEEILLAYFWEGLISGDQQLCC
ncbi:WD repeat-containing protein on Y chromosome [Varanus komodoensis]|nr:WD repeat-containing protein on Y chromosome [Varanus komodoensis]